MSEPAVLPAATTKERVLLVNVLVVAVCALVYELLCGTIASYLLGNAVLQFSLVLGTYLFAMGAGAWMSRAFEARAEPRYVQVELVLALVGGLSVPALLALVSKHVPVGLAIHAFVFVVGALVGLELPLLVHMLRARRGEPAPAPAPTPAPGPARPFGDVVARALAHDYLGALAASLLFPLVLVPELGLVRTSALAGLLNAAAALSSTFVLRTPRPRLLRAAGLVVMAILVLAFLRAEAAVAGTTD